MRVVSHPIELILVASFANPLIDVGHALQDIVKSIMPYFSRLQDPSEDITVGIALTTTHKQNRDKIESRSVSLDLRIDKPFWPMFNGVTEHLDKLVWTYLSLQLRGTEGGSPLLPHVSKAGGYLCLLFPAAGAADSVHKSDGVDACNGDIERRLEAHFARFSIIRFAELIDGTMTAIRSIDTAHMTRNECLDAIAAAGVLYCELEYVNQGLRNGSLRLLWVSRFKTLHVSTVGNSKNLRIM
jgi:hypothetical protein